jgi:protease-4
MNIEQTNYNQAPATNHAPRKTLSFWLSIILGVLLVISIGANMILLVLISLKFTPPTAGDTKKAFQETIVKGDKNSADKILLIPVNGVIMSNDEESSFWNQKMDPVRYITEVLEQGEADKSIKAIILEVNSPGGGITACDKIYNALKRFKKARPDVIMVSYMTDIAASGGYYISSATDRIFANPTTITGSIGVISMLLNMEGLFTKLGLNMEVIKSADKKDIGSSFRQMTPEERKILQDIIDEMYQRFVSVVVSGRPKLTREQILTLADGRIYTGEQALKNGLVDEIGYTEEVIDATKKLANINNAKIIEYRKKFVFWEMFESLSKDLSAVKSPGDSLKALLLEKNTPKLMYLWTVN